MALAETVPDSNWERTFYGSPSRECNSPVGIRRDSYSMVRDLLERALALLLLLLSAPVIGILVLAIKASSRGPGIYCQRRVGLGGRVYLMYKLRSMRCDAEARTGPVWASAGQDPRVTPLGHWLRHLHLDELPQLYNIVRGEMSLVGPRPERPEFVGLLAEQIPGYWDRLKVKPGITGLAQINLPPDTDLHSVRCKLVLDREYVNCASPFLDARIVLCTVLRLVGVRGGRAVSWLGLKRVVKLEPDSRATETAPPLASTAAAESEAELSERTPLAASSPLAAVRS